MRNRPTANVPTLALIAAAGAGLLLAGCQGGSAGVADESATVDPPAQEALADAGGLSGAELWAQTCAHCHNPRSPAGYSDGKWELAMRHMRTQANLSAEQYRKILEFLKASN